MKDYLYNVDWGKATTWALNALLFSLILYNLWVYKDTDEQIRDMSVESFKTGYIMARPHADSEEVEFHVEWYRRAISSGSTAYYAKPGAVVYEEPSKSSTPIDTLGIK